MSVIITGRDALIALSFSFSLLPASLLFSSTSSLLPLLLHLSSILSFLYLILVSSHFFFCFFVCITTTSPLIERVLTTATIAYYYYHSAWLSFLLLWEFIPRTIGRNLPVSLVSLISCVSYSLLGIIISIFFIPVQLCSAWLPGLTIARG